MKRSAILHQEPRQQEIVEQIDVKRSRSDILKVAPEPTVFRKISGEGLKEFEDHDQPQKATDSKYQIGPYPIFRMWIPGE